MNFGNPVDKGRYQQLAGKLIYLSHTKLDIAFPDSCISPFMHALSENHVKVVHQIIKYLK